MTQSETSIAEGLSEAQRNDPWYEMKLAPIGVLVELLYDFPSGEKPVQGVYRSGLFWGRNTVGWWADYEPHPPRYGFDTKMPGMWIDGWIKSWRPLPEARGILYEPEHDLRIRSYLISKGS